MLPWLRLILDLPVPRSDSVVPLHILPEKKGRFLLPSPRSIGLKIYWEGYFYLDMSYWSQDLDMYMTKLLYSFSGLDTFGL